MWTAKAGEGGTSLRRVILEADAVFHVVKRKLGDARDIRPRRGRRRTTDGSGGKDGLKDERGERSYLLAQPGSSSSVTSLARREDEVGEGLRRPGPREHGWLAPAIELR